MAAHPEDPVGDELDALLKQPEIRQRLDESQRRFEAGETRPIPHKDVHRQAVPAILDSLTVRQNRLIRSKGRTFRKLGNRS